MGYADDLTIVVRGRFPKVVVERMQTGAKCSWCKQEGLSVSAQNTH